MRGIGYSRLWGWFGLSRAAWLILPRSIMHEMPDEWQGRMATLLEELEATYPKGVGDYEFFCTMKENGKFIKIPDWLTNYRHNPPGWSEYLKYKSE